MCQLPSHWVLTYCTLSVAALSKAEITRLEDSINNTALRVENSSPVNSKMAELAAKRVTLRQVEVGLRLGPLLWGLMSWFS